MPNPEIRLLVLDVDGVLTDGTILVDEQGGASRRFHVQDGLGIGLWRGVGRQAGILTSKRSGAVAARAEALSIDFLEQGAEDKLPGFERMIAAARVTCDQVAYVGDDLLDAVVMRRVGYPIAVANAVDPIKGLARYVTRAAGGHGGVRDAIEHLLQREKQWDIALRTIGADR